MSTPQIPDPTSADPTAPAPKPHRCPWWMHYLLVSPLRRLAESPEKLLGAHVEPGMTVVEPGCGFGYFSLPLARQVGPTGRVISVDVEPRAIQRLQKRARAAGVSDRIEARECQTRDLGLAAHNGTVDLMAVIHTLHELEDLPGFLSQTTALLKPTGRLLVIEPPGHVSAEKFAAQVAACCQAGLRPVDAPAPGLPNRAALFRAPRPAD